MEKEGLRYILAPRFQPPHEVVNEFIWGKGVSGNKLPVYLNPNQPNFRNKAFYALMNPVSLHGGYLVTTMSGLDRATVWQLDNDSLRVVYEGGLSLGDSASLGDMAVLLPSGAKPLPLLVRLDSTMSIYPDFLFFSHSGYWAWKNQRTALQNRVIGAMLMGVLFMLYMAMAGQARGRWLFVLAQICIAWWNVSRMGVALPIDHEGFQRLSLLVPLFGYFAVAPMALMSAMRMSDTESGVIWKSARLLQVVTLVNLCLAVFFGVMTAMSEPTPYSIPFMFGTMAISQLAMLCYCMAAVRSGLACAWLVLIGESICAVGFGLLIIRQFTDFFVDPYWSNIINVAIVSELLFWNYVTELFRKWSEKRLKADIENSKGALICSDLKLDDSYSMLTETNLALLSVKTSGHAMHNQISRVEVGVELGEIDQVKKELAELRRSLLAQGQVICSSVGSGRRAYGRAGEVLARRTASAATMLAKRGQILRQSVASDAAVAFVDEYLMTEVLRELFTNAAKYGRADEVVTVSMGLRDCVLQLQVDSPADIEPERLTLLGKIEVQPDKPRNGETSTGKGLYLIAQLLRMSGGGLRVSSVEGCVRVIATLPLFQDEERLRYLEPVAALQR